MAATSVFPSTLSVAVEATGALTGDGTAGNELAVSVDGSSILVNGSNQINGILHQGHTNIANANIITLPTLAVDVVSAPGSNKILLPMFALLHLNWVADYGNIDATCAMYIVTNNQGFLLPVKEAGGSAQVTGLLGASGSNSAFMQGNFLIAGGGGYGSWSSYYDSDTINKPISLLVTNGAAGNFTLGNAGNSLDVAVSYLIYDLTLGTFV